MAGFFATLGKIVSNLLRGPTLARRNLEEGERFRRENAARPGVTVTPSGLQYEVLIPGDGPRPSPMSRLTVHYRGTLTDGFEFDSSHARGQPFSLRLHEVIPGWWEGLRLMPVGSRYRFVIPPELAYGIRGAGKIIGANATLVFEVELLECRDES